METTFKAHRAGDVIVTERGRVLLITGALEPMLYTAIVHETGEAVAIDAAAISFTSTLTDAAAQRIRQQYLDQFYRPVLDDAPAEFIEAMLGNRSGSHADLLARLSQAVHETAKETRSHDYASDKHRAAEVEYIRSLERYYQAVTKYSSENDSYRNSKHDTQPLSDCVFWQGGYCDCDSPEPKDYCSSDPSVIESDL